MSDFYSIIEDLERKTMETLEETRQEYRELLRSFDINPRPTAEEPRPQEPEQDFNLIENHGIDLQDDRYERMFQDLIQHDTGIDKDFWNTSSSANGSSVGGDMGHNEIVGCTTLNPQPNITTNDESNSELPDYETMMSSDIPPQITVHDESSPLTAAAREAPTLQHSGSAGDNDTNVLSEMPPLISAQNSPAFNVGAYEEVSTCNSHQQSESESEGHESGQEEAGPEQQEPPFMELIRSVRADMTNDPLPCSSGLQVRRKKTALRSSQRRCIPYNQYPSYSYHVTASCKRKAHQVYTDDEEDSDDDDGLGVNGAVRPLPAVHRRKRIRVKADTQEGDADDEDSDEEHRVAAQPPPPAQRQRPKRPRVEAGAAQEDEDTDGEFEVSPPPPEQRLKRPRVRAETSDGDSDYWLVVERLHHAETSTSDEGSGSDEQPPTRGQYRNRVLHRDQVLRSGRGVDVLPSPVEELEFLAHELRFNGFPIYEAVCVMRATFDKARNMQDHWRRRGIDTSHTVLESIILRDPILWSIYLLMPETRDDFDLIRDVVMELADELQDDDAEPRPGSHVDADNVIWISSDDNNEDDDDEREPENEVYWVSSGSGDDSAAIVDDDLNRQ